MNKIAYIYRNILLSLFLLELFASDDKPWLDPESPEEHSLSSNSLYQKMMMKDTSNIDFTNKVEQGLSDIDLNYFKDGNILTIGEEKIIDYWMEPVSKCGFFLDWQFSLKANFEIKLINPSGLEFDEINHLSDISFIKGTHQTLVLINNPLSGNWKIKIKALSVDTENSDFILNFFSNSLIKVGIDFYESDYNLDEPIHFQIKVMDDNKPLKNLNVKFQIFEEANSTPSEIILKDDGLNNDETSNDGIYGKTIIAQKIGSFGVKIFISGNNINGQFFEREFVGGYTVIPKKKVLTFQKIEEKTIGDHPPYDGFKIIFEISGDSDIFPRYINGILFDQNDKNLTVGNGTVVLIENKIIGTIVFYGNDLFLSNTDGPYKLSFINLSDENYKVIYENFDVFASDVYISSDFKFDDKDNDGLSDSKEAEFGTNPTLVDTDNDGLTDYEEVNFDGNANDYTPLLDTDPLNPDTDGDEHLDGLDDAFPLDPNEWQDNDGDGKPDFAMNVKNTDMLVTANDGIFNSTIELKNMESGSRFDLYVELYNNDWTKRIGSQWFYNVPNVLIDIAFSTAGFSGTNCHYQVFLFKNQNYDWANPECKKYITGINIELCNVLLIVKNTDTLVTANDGIFNSTIVLNNLPSDARYDVFVDLSSNDWSKRIGYQWIYNVKSGEINIAFATSGYAGNNCHYRVYLFKN